MLIDDLVRRFYAWERRGRGWDIWPNYIAPEPAFLPFLGHYIEVPPVDDGRKPTFLSRVARDVVDAFGTDAPRIPARDDEIAQEVEPTLFGPIDHWSELRLTLGRDVDLTKSVLEKFFVSLSLQRNPVVFEIIGLRDKIFVQFSASPDDERNVHEQLRMHFPSVAIQLGNDALSGAWKTAQGVSLVADFGLSREFMLPLSSAGNLNPDPLTGLFAVLEGLKANEIGVYQVIFQPVRSAWASSVFRAVTLPDGSPFFDDLPDFLAQTRTKVSRPLCATIVRFGAKATDTDRVVEIVRNVASSFVHIFQPQWKRPDPAFKRRPL